MASNVPYGIPPALMQACGALRATLDAAAPGKYIVGVGRKQVGGTFTDQVVVFVYVPEKLALADVSSRERVPGEVNGIPTDVVPYRRVELDDTNVYNPLRGGIQISPPSVPDGVLIHTNPGTLGAIVRGRAGTVWAGQSMLLTCAHVAEAVGRPIHQPAHNHAGAVIGTVVDSRRQESPVTLDCALVQLTAPLNVLTSIEGIGPVKGPAVAELWEPIKKRGARTLVTQGFLARLVPEAASPGIVPRIKEMEITGFPFDQVIAGKGDSGCAVLNARDEILGILFATRDQNLTSDGLSPSALVMPIQNAADALGVDVAVTPAVTSVVPNTGPAALLNFGRVVVNGWGFSGTSQVVFGSAPAAVISATPARLEVLLPAQLATVVDVRVTNAFGETSAASDQTKFTY